MAALHVTDSRTSRTYRIPIHDNAIDANDVLQIKCHSDQIGNSEDTIEGLRILDSGFRNTAVLRSSITKLDGKAGIIRYRDHDIKDLFEKRDFEDAAFLLIRGHLPSATEKQSFVEAITASLIPPPEVLSVVASMPKIAPDFTIIIAALSAWNAAQDEYIPRVAGALPYNMKNPEALDQGAIRTLAIVTACTALAYCHRKSINFTTPRPARSIPYNLLLMCGIVDSDTGQPDPEHTRLLSKVMLLYADHEMTNSTAAFLHVGSTLADPISCSIAAVAAGNGPLHGGAIDFAYKQFSAIGDISNVDAFLDQVREKKTRIFGFGHRIWRSTDPRYHFVRQLIDSEVLRDSINANPLLAIALEVERKVSQEQFFTKKRIRANVDLICSFVFVALGFTEDSVLSIASAARTAGVVAHWKEQVQQPVSIWRPQSIFIEPAAPQSLKSETELERLNRDFSKARL